MESPTPLYVILSTEQVATYHSLNFWASMVSVLSRSLSSLRSVRFMVCMRNHLAEVFKQVEHQVRTLFPQPVYCESNVVDPLEVWLAVEHINQLDQRYISRLHIRHIPEFPAQLCDQRSFGEHNSSMNKLFYTLRSIVLFLTSCKRRTSLSAQERRRRPQHWLKNLEQPKSWKRSANSIRGYRIEIIFLLIIHVSIERDQIQLPIVRDILLNKCLDLKRRHKRGIGTCYHSEQQLRIFSMFLFGLDIGLLSFGPSSHLRSLHKPYHPLIAISKERRTAKSSLSPVQCRVWDLQSSEFWNVLPAKPAQILILAQHQSQKHSNVN